MRSSRRTARSIRGLLGALAVTLLAVPSVFAAAPSPVPEPLQDSVTGQASFVPSPFFSFGVTLDAHSGPQGESPTGSVFVIGRGGAAGGPVICLTVTGNRATIGFESTVRPGEGGFIFVEDNGWPGAGLDNLIVLLTAVPPSTCPANSVDYGPGDVASAGEITVIDAQPVPTSKDQCKHGGWRTFGETFKNQGQCVAFVQRGPNP